ncbi:hypothetical protein JCM8547_008360 [Rhodosporidiobolus lusitaniae]
MRSTFSLAATVLATAHAASAFTYSIGVGKDEVTGNPGIGFDPSYTVISAHGDGNVLAFEFLGGQHRVVQTSGVDAPCAASGGFDSGLVSVPAGILQGSGPTQTFAITNDTEVLYFADIGEDNSPCYLGAVFCVNTNEGSDQACHVARTNALALGTQYGVTATPSATASSTSSGAGNSTSSAASTSAASSSSATSSGSSSAASRTASGTASAAAESASQSGGSNAAGSVKIGAAGVVLAAVAGVAALA